MTTIHNLIEARRRDKDNEGGFTLIELLIVIVVLGILAAIVVFAVQNLTKDSSATACRSDAKQVETALEAFKAKTGAYPAAAAAFVPIDATNPTGFVGVGNYIRSGPGQSRYVIGLQQAASTGLSDGLVYVKAPPPALAAAATTQPTSTTAGTEFNTGDPCKNAG